MGNLLLTRHGETEGSLADVYGGRAPSPVTNKGQQQIQHLVRRLESVAFAAVYSSPLDRCREAAEQIASPRGLDVVTVDPLIEIDNGQWEGLSREQLSQQFGGSYGRWQMDPAGNGPPGGETGYDVARRAVPAIISLMQRYTDGNVLVMAHSTVNRILMCHFLGLPIVDYRKHIFQSPASINWITFLSDGGYQVKLMNDTSHCDHLV